MDASRRSESAEAFSLFKIDELIHPPGEGSKERNTIQRHPLTKYDHGTALETLDIDREYN